VSRKKMLECVMAQDFESACQTMAQVYGVDQERIASDMAAGRQQSQFRQANPANGWLFFKQNRSARCSFIQSSGKPRARSDVLYPAASASRAGVIRNAARRGYKNIRSEYGTLPWQMKSARRPPMAAGLYCNMCCSRFRTPRTGKTIP
jgi:hypothetical protein